MLVYPFRLTHPSRAELFTFLALILFAQRVAIKMLHPLCILSYPPDALLRARYSLDQPEISSALEPAQSWFEHQSTGMPGSKN